MRSVGTPVFVHENNPYIVEPDFPVAEARQDQNGFWTWWEITRAEVVADLRTTGWSRIGLWFSVLCWQGGLLMALVLTPLVLDNPWQYRSSACRPDGSFSTWGPGYNPWNFSDVFQITAAFGTLSFTQAKAIDIVWDIAFTTYARNSLENGSVTYNTFWTIFMRDDASLQATVRMIRDFTSRRGLQSKIAMLFIILTMVLVLAFPTLASAMTGYTLKFAAFVKDTDGNFVQFSQFGLLAYIIHDDWRIGLDGDYPVTHDIDNGRDPVIQPGASSYRRVSSCSFSYRLKADSENCYLQFNVSDYVSKYGFLGEFNGSTLWNNKTELAPALNISAYYLEDLSRYAFTKANKTHSLNYVANNGTASRSGFVTSMLRLNPSS
ncbi:hypothetical protein JX266_010398 [Neoarthrinium moseri]|nr:hypothetical protein JX266_010398 [Neoarthrinium moseri]